MGHTEGHDGLLPHKSATSRVWQLWLCLVHGRKGIYVKGMSPITMLSMGRFVACSKSSI